MTEEFLKRGEANDVHLCERHFKAESPVDHH